jgi:hypothetical protein
LPQIDGVSLLDIDHVEGDAIAIGLVEPIELGNLPAKWRSSITAEDQDHRTLTPFRR